MEVYMLDNNENVRRLRVLAWWEKADGYCRPEVAMDEETGEIFVLHMDDGGRRKAELERIDWLCLGLDA